MFWVLFLLLLKTVIYDMTTREIIYLLSNLASIQHNLFINSLIIYNIPQYVLYACSEWSLYYVNLLYKWEKTS